MAGLPTVVPDGRRACAIWATAGGGRRHDGRMRLVVAAALPFLFLPLAACAAMADGAPAPVPAVAAAPVLDPTQPPPFRLQVTIDGVAREFVDGVEAVADVGGRARTVRVDVAPLRRFAAGEVAFDFPRDMAFEHEDEVGVLQIWTLEGSRITVMVHRFLFGEADDFLASTLSSMAEGFAAVSDEAPAKPEPCKVMAGGVERRGQRIAFAIAGNDMATTAFALDVGKGCVAVMVQDTPDEDGEPSAECTRFLELLAQTFEVTAPAPAGRRQGGAR